jgi:hypothetical protein
VSTTEELLGRRSSSSGLETEITATGILRADHVTPFYLQKLALTSPISGGRLVGVVRLRPEATELFIICYFVCIAGHIVGKRGFGFTPNNFVLQLLEQTLFPYMFGKSKIIFVIKLIKIHSDRQLLKFVWNKLWK